MRVDKDDSLIHHGEMKNPKFWETKPCAVCGNPFESLIKRQQKTCCAKCSGVYVARQSDRVAKIKQTKLDRYGSSTYVNPDKAKQTCLKRYGVDNASKSMEIIAKIKSATKEKYGVDSFFQTDEFKRKAVECHKKNFGVEFTSQRPDVKEKKRNIFMERYGVENPLQAEEVRAKIKADCIEKYGVDHSSKREDVRDKMRKTSCSLTFSGVVERLKSMSKCTPLFSVEEYHNTDVKNKYRFRCNQCGGEFLDHIDGGHLPRCVKCFPLSQSKAQTEIVAFIKSVAPTLEVMEDSRSVLPSGKEVDIYLPTLKLAIEYDSFYYHGEFSAGRGKRYHSDKTDEAESAGITLLHIFEDEWANKADVVKSVIKNKLIQNRYIGARKTLVKQIDHAMASVFLNAHHIQGSLAAKVYLGAFIGEELVGVMTFSNHRVALGEKGKSTNTEYEIIRFATSKSVYGLGSKMLRFFIDNFHPTKITTFLDLRYSSVKSNIYTKMGFTLVKKTAPNYWYFKIGYNKKFHRYSFRKSELKNKLEIFNPMLSETDNMKNNDYDRIWDCGNLRYEMIFS